MLPVVRTSQACIAAGLAILLAGTLTGAMPILTGMACIALGTTLATVDRFQYSPALTAVITVHLATYSLLYLLFIGASLHAAHAQEGGVVSLAALIDLAASATLMVATVRAGLNVLAEPDQAPPRR